MNVGTFEALVDKYFRRQAQVMHHKAKEYADDTDLLRNFKLAAQLQGVTPRQALGGMLAKELISVFDLINEREIAPEHIWDQKLGNASNYLGLLRALAAEELTNQQLAQAQSEPRLVIDNNPQETPGA